MQMTMTSRFSRHICWAAAVAAILWPALDAFAQEKKIRIVRTLAAQADESADKAPAASEAHAGPSRWWLGLECLPVEPSLAKHLRLKSGQGLVVLHVVEDSAAHEAGLHIDDVLLRAGERDLHSLRDLVDAVNDSQGNKLKIELIREGEKQWIEVAPKQRPRDLFLGPAMQLERAGPLRFRVLGPGAIEPFHIKLLRERPKLPKDVTVTITATGEEPLRVKVEQGDQTWDLAEDELDQLPEDLQPAVQAMLPGNSAFRPMDPFQGTMPDGFPHGGRLIDPNAREDRFPEHKDLQKQIDELRQRFEALQKEFRN